MALFYEVMQVNGEKNESDFTGQGRKQYDG